MRRVRVVLVRPQYAGNIGSVARIMENFGAGSLYLVAPQADHLSRESTARSTHGEHRLHSARIVPALGAALEGVVYAFATSRWRGPICQPEDLTPRRCAEIATERVIDGDVALVFGTEDKGLSRADLLACDAVVQIPARPDYPTLNVAHAVVICLYEAFLAMSGECKRPAVSDMLAPPADLAMIDRLMAKLGPALGTIGYLDPQKPDHLLYPIRAILSRARLTRVEAQILMGLAQQIEEFAAHGNRRRGS